jgi:hypothetical protein
MFFEGELHYTIGSATIRNYEEGWIILHQTKYLKKLNYKNFEVLLVIL